MASLKVNDGGTWKACTPWVNDGGTWKKPLKVWVNDGGTWKTVWVSITFTEPDGFYSLGTTIGSASMTLHCSEPVVWTYTKSGQGTVSIVSGATSATLTYSGAKNQVGQLNVSAAGHSWTLALENGA